MSTNSTKRPESGELGSNQRPLASGASSLPTDLSPESLSGGTRTPDPVIPNHARYQLRYAQKVPTKRFERLKACAPPVSKTGLCTNSSTLA